MRFLQIDFMRRRNLWFAISGTVILIGLVSLATRGLNLGIDFKGGVQITFKTQAFTPIQTVRDQMKLIGHEKDAVVQGRGASQNGDSYKNFQVRLKKLTNAQQSRLDNALKNNVKAFGEGTKSVSSSFGKQIARSAIWAIAFSLLIITGYITLRFHGLAFALPVIVALLHDIVITVGVYSLTGREVTESTVAAVLTVPGYSIYDTIIEGSVASRILRQAEVEAAEEPSPETPLDVVEAVVGDGAAEAKRELRRQRRKSRPHGRAR